MAIIRLKSGEIQCKVVYYGPGQSGKTTNLITIHKAVGRKARGDLISINTSGDRTIFFDLLPLDLGTIKDLNIKISVYTVPGQVHYNDTRKLVLKGSDGIVFVGDTLFAGSIGRTDFPGGNYETLIASIQNKLFPLGDEVRVLSGHGPETSIGREKQRRNNPFVGFL